MNEIKELIDGRINTKSESADVVTSLAGVLVGLALGKLGSKVGNDNAKEFLISVLNNLDSVNEPPPLNSLN